MSDNPNRIVVQCPFCSKSLVDEHGKPPTYCWHCCRTLPLEASAQFVKSDASPVPMVSKPDFTMKILMVVVGVIIVMVGVALIIISPILFDTSGLIYTADVQSYTALGGIASFSGVALLIVGGIISAIGFIQLISTRPTMPAAPTTLPVVTPSVSPKSVELGNTPDKVQANVGQPDKIIDLGTRAIHVYKDMKIIYVDGKVSDVELS